MHDRGTMKWTSLMMPEQVEGLQQMWKDMERKEKPILDEQQVLENTLVLQEALEFDLKISIRYYADFDYLTDEGYLLHIDGINRVIYMEETEIQFDNLIEVNIL